MQNSMWKKDLVYGIIMLFVGMSVLSITAIVKTWGYVKIEGEITGLLHSNAFWNFAFPPSNDSKKFEYNFYFHSSYASGCIEIHGNCIMVGIGENI